jgi:nucleotide-binding universal stress UspA family protein
MKKILVPTDFSACANSAIEFAVQTAKLIPAEITLLHSFELMGNLYTDYMGVNKEFNQNQLQEVCHKLTEIKKNIKATEEVQVDTHVCTGAVKKCVLQAVNERNIDFMIMGTAGASGFKEALWGSKTADIIGKSHVPVIAIPCNYTWKRPAKILLATNHFEKEPVILDLLFELAALYGAQVNVAVFTNERDDSAITYLEHMRKTPAYVNLLKEHYQEGSLTITNLFGQSFEETLNEYNNTNDIDLLAMITYQRSFPDSIFHPSLTRQIACHTNIPLLAIPANKPA